MGRATGLIRVRYRANKRALKTQCSPFIGIPDVMFQPKFTISPAAAISLMAIEADRQAIMELPINVDVLAGLRETARLAATHYSTQIEGNRLTQAQVAEALAGAHFPGRERDEAEVRNYYRALEHIEFLAVEGGSINELELRRVLGFVGFLNFFCDSMAQTLGSVRARATDVAQTPGNRHADDAAALRQLDPRQRRALELFRDSAVVTSSDIAAHLGISPRTANTLIRSWIDDDFLEVDDPSKKKRTYRLRPQYERLVSP
ncbi:hypothetical protein [Nocardia sp. NBC_01388]|uniref:hypothetical protein n=1 Tax=Nocardia sp. NBC_01388 TaxID=2903596 RepID=UPI0032523DF0